MPHTKTFTSVSPGTTLTRSGLSILLSHLADSRGDRRAGLTPPHPHREARSCPVSWVRTTGVRQRTCQRLGEQRRATEDKTFCNLLRYPREPSHPLSKKAACGVEACQERRRPAVRGRSAQVCSALPAWVAGGGEHGAAHTCLPPALWGDMAIPICPPDLSQACWGHTSLGCKVCPFAPLLVHNWVCARHPAARPPSPEACDGSREPPAEAQGCLPLPLPLPRPPPTWHGYPSAEGNTAELILGSLPPAPAHAAHVLTHF